MSVEGMLPLIEVAKKLAQVKAIEQLPASRAPDAADGGGLAPAGCFCA
jgi:hypothetical protein